MHFVCSLTNKMPENVRILTFIKIQKKLESRAEIVYDNRQGGVSSARVPKK
jgi:hypothetical protein